MRIFSLFFVLFLSGAWMYTSWFWYTCHVRGFCDGQIPQMNQTGAVSEEDEEYIGTSNNTSGASLSSGDVLGTSSKKLEENQENAATQSGTQTGVLNQSGVVLAQTGSSQKVPALEKTDIPDLDKIDICETPLLGPITYGKNNDEIEVQKLEAFLVSQGNKVIANGSYDLQEYEAVKAFQLKYRSEILDPWGISNPTGYVFRTTIQKMTEVACK